MSVLRPSSSVFSWHRLLGGIFAFSVFIYSGCARDLPQKSPKQERCSTEKMCDARCDQGEVESCEVGLALLIKKENSDDHSRELIRFAERACDLNSADGCMIASSSFIKKGIAAAVGGEGLRFLEKACKLEKAEACTFAGQFLMEDPVGNNRANEAKSFFEKACRLGDARGCGQQALVLIRDIDPADQAAWNKIIPLMETSCRADPGYCWRLGELYRHGAGVPEDGIKAEELIKLSCDDENVYGCHSLASLYESGAKGLPKALSKAVKLFSDLCEKSHWRSCVRLGARYEHGGGVDKDPSRAAKFYEDACNHGDKEGCNGLGYLLSIGRGVPKNESKAIELFRTACEANEPKSCANLGNAHRDGAGLAKSDSLAYQFYERSCSMKNRISCAEMALMQVQGRGVAKNLNLGIQKLKDSCSDGVDAACSNIASFYLAGDFLPKDYSKALQFGQKACEIDPNSSGCAKVGVIYSQGYLGSPDHAKAVVYFGRSCENGVALVCLLMGESLLEIKENEAKTKAISAFEKACYLGEKGGCYRAAELNTANFAGENGQITIKSADFYERACQLSHAEGCWTYGSLLLKGKIPNRDPIDSLPLIKETFASSCKFGDPAGCVMLSQMVAREDPKFAKELLEKTCDMGEKGARWCPRSKKPRK